MVTCFFWPMQRPPLAHGNLLELSGRIAARAADGATEPKLYQIVRAGTAVIPVGQRDMAMRRGENNVPQLY